ncbi:MAG: response regulator [Blastocatellia bacterium]|nr:response regulator [Blastocatellia bacterium]
MKILIVDDEPLARDEVRFLVSQQADCEVIGEAENGMEAVERIESLNPDVVLLDIQMPGLSGFDVLRALHTETLPLFVFITAFDRYAIQAFEVSAVDYLLKPVEFERLQRALHRCRERLSHRKETDRQESGLPAQTSMSAFQAQSLQELQSLLAALPAPPRYARQLVGRKQQRILLVPTEDVFCIEMESQLVFLVTEKDRYWTNDTLTEVLARLDPEIFVRVHRQAAVRLTAVRELAPLSNERMLLRLNNGHEVTASRNYLPELKARLGLK